MSGRRERTANKPDKDDMLKAISIIPLEMRAEIGRSTILASQLGQLKIGDVVCLNRRVDSDIDVFIGERCCYRAELGARRGKVAVKLARPFVEAEEGRPVSPPANQAAKKPM
jgi:flagellar motor switch protein FliM